jgi:hypothetical protein
MTRLIDADALKLTGCHVINNDGSKTVKAAVMEEDLDNAPTIDAVPVTELKDTEKERDYWMNMAHSYEQTILRLTISAGEVPVRHGKWKNDCMGVLRCSECGAQAPWRYKGEMYDMVDYRWKANYCPQCGARMDEE